MQLPFYQVDAFTNQVFRGNPAAVCPLENWLPDSQLQAIAAENNLSETAFFITQPTDGKYPLRWFTPTAEIDLCGHATLATAFVLFEQYKLSEKMLSFSTQSGTLSVEKRRDWYFLNFPSRKPTVPEVVPEELTNDSALGIAPQHILKSRDFVLVFRNEDEVRQLQPNFAILGEIPNVIGFIATAPGKHADFVSRFFAPAVGVPEDPVTGSAHSSLIPHWAEKLGKQVLTAQQLSSRGGELQCKQLDNQRVEIGGQAVLYAEGTLYLS